MFKGRAMTYYGRWTYKYEIAAQKGAAAAVIIHETEPAAYPYSVVDDAVGRRRTSRSIAPDKNMDQVAIRSLGHARRREEIARRQRPGFRCAEKGGHHARISNRCSFGANGQLQSETSRALV